MDAIRFVISADGICAGPDGDYEMGKPQTSVQVLKAARNAVRAFDEAYGRWASLHVSEEVHDASIAEYIDGLREAAQAVIELLSIKSLKIEPNEEDPDQCPQRARAIILEAAKKFDVPSPPRISYSDEQKGLFLPTALRCLRIHLNLLKTRAEPPEAALWEYVKGNKIKNANLARLVEVKPRHLTNVVSKALKDAGFAIKEGSPGKDRFWGFDTLRKAHPYIPDGTKVEKGINKVIGDYYLRNRNEIAIPKTNSNPQ